MPMYAEASTLLPDGLSYEQAAPIFCAGYTVHSGLRWANPKPHERVAVLGTGGLGHLAVQYAKAAGFETIAVSQSPDKDKMIREFGADEIVRDGKSLAAAGGADIILSTSNSTKAMADSIQGLRFDGRLVAVGADAEPIAVPLTELIFKRIQVIGSSQKGRQYLYEAPDYAARGKVKSWRKLTLWRKLRKPISASPRARLASEQFSQCNSGARSLSLLHRGGESDSRARHVRPSFALSMVAVAFEVGSVLHRLALHAAIFP
jgi:D-arabinose 1-dehydrogenase-like Zn-dependent alcohol dehydrogenase